MTPGRAPPYRQALAWPNSWNAVADDDRAEHAEQQERLVDARCAGRRPGRGTPKSQTSNATRVSSVSATTAGTCSQVNNRAPGVDRPLRQQRAAVMQRRDRLALVERRRAAVAQGEDAERPQLALGDEGDLVGADRPAAPGAHVMGDRVDVAPAVGGVGYGVEQLGQLDDLAVRAPRDEGRVPEA